MLARERLARSNTSDSVINKRYYSLTRTTLTVFPRSNATRPGRHARISAYAPIPRLPLTVRSSAYAPVPEPQLSLDCMYMHPLFGHYAERTDGTSRSARCLRSTSVRRGSRSLRRGHSKPWRTSRRRGLRMLQEWAGASRCSGGSGVRDTRVAWPLRQRRACTLETKAASTPETLGKREREAEGGGSGVGDVRGPTRVFRKADRSPHAESRRSPAIAPAPLGRRSRTQASHRAPQNRSTPEKPKSHSHRAPPKAASAQTAQTPKDSSASRKSKKLPTAQAPRAPLAAHSSTLR